MFGIPTSRGGRRFVAVGAVAALALTGVVASTSGGSARAEGDHAAASAFLQRALLQGIQAPGRRAPGRSFSVGGLTQVSYLNWSGYADSSTGKTKYSAVSGSWTEPKVSCPAKENEVSVFWVGVDGLADSTVEQDGTLAECYAGAAYYYTWWEMYPTNEIQVVGSTVAPGDQIAASVKVSKGTYTLAVTDSTTTANSFSESEKCGSGVTCADSSAEWIAETPSYSRGYAPWPSFGKWTVTGASVTGAGKTGVISTFKDDEITMVNSWDQNLGTTGALDSTKNGFTETWAYSW
jgi:hypothetical protein